MVVGVTLIALGAVVGPEVGVAQEAVSGSDVGIRVAALANDRPEDDEAARSSLVKLGPGVVQHLAPVLLDADQTWEVRTSVAWVLAEVSNDRSVPALKKAWKLPDAPGSFRIQVAIALGTYGKPAALRSFLQPDAPDKVLVAKAAIASANLKDPQALALMAPFVNDPDIGPFVAIASCRLGDNGAMDLVRPLLKDPVFRDHAAVALAAAGDTTITLPLRFALENVDPFVRSEAAAGLARLKDHDSYDRISKMAMEDADPRVRKAARRALIRLGKGRSR
jgi:HEAT repeat protein